MVFVCVFDSMCISVTINHVQNRKTLTMSLFLTTKQQNMCYTHNNRTTGNQHLQQTKQKLSKGKFQKQTHFILDKMFILCHFASCVRLPFEACLTIIPIVTCSMRLPHSISCIFWSDTFVMTDILTLPIFFEKKVKHFYLKKF